MTFCNPRLFNDLATRLEALPAYTLEPSGPYLDEMLADARDPGRKPAFTTLDRFAMLADLRSNDTDKPWVTDAEGRVVGNLQAWLAQELLRSGTYPAHLAPLDPPALNHGEVNALTGYFLGPLAATGLAALPPALMPLLNPTQLYGRMDAVTAKDAGSVLRAVAKRIPPDIAWQDVGMRIRKERLKTLAGAVSTVPFIPAPRDRGQPVSQLHTHETLREKLTTFGVNTDGLPVAMPDGSWCGDLAVWTVRLFGAFLNHHFVGPLNRPTLFSAPALIGLTNIEAAALFRGFVYPSWGVSPKVSFANLGTLRMRDTDSTVDTLNLLAAGAMPPIEWEKMEYPEEAEDVEPA